MEMERVLTGDLSLYVEGKTIREEMLGGFMDAVTYTAVVDHTIIVCTDAVIVDVKRRTFFLAKRCVRPMRGLWWIGGRRRKGETPTEAMQRNFFQETSLHLPAKRFVFTTITEYLWKSRKQIPRDHGSHNLCHQFTVELSSTERTLAARSLEMREYQREYGLQEFNRARLVTEKVHPVILETYDTVFPA